MTNPASPGGDERPPPAPYEPTERFAPAEPAESFAPAEPAQSFAPAEPAEPFEPTPAYDALAAEAPLSEPVGATAGTSALTPEADYALAPSPTDAGPLGQVKAFAAQKPAAFLGAALAAGWLIGKITSRGKRRSAGDGD
jgi:hypothetical protein